MKLICQPLDFVGQNIYDGRMVEMGKDGSRYFPRNLLDLPIPI